MVRYMKTRFTNKQKIALWGLIKYPAFNDRETSDKIKMKLSTLTTIRYRMLDECVYKMVNVPVVNRMAFEMAAVFIIRLASASNNKDLGFKKDEFPNLVYIAHDQNRILALGFYPDYTLAVSDLNDLAAKLRKSKLIARSGHWMKYIPLGNYEVPNYFDESIFVNQGLELNRPEAITSKGSIFKGDAIHLSSFERKVLNELVAFPEETDVQLSKNLKITRSTVARIRSRLLGLAYKTLNIVDLAKLGYKAISIAAPDYSMTYDEGKGAIVKAASNLGYPIFFAVSDNSCVFMTAHKELRGIRNRTNNAFKGGAFKGHIQDPSHIATFNLRTLKVLRNHDYVNLTRQVLELYYYKPKKRKKANVGQ